MEATTRVRIPTDSFLRLALIYDGCSSFSATPTLRRVSFTIWQFRDSDLLEAYDKVEW
ncbi:MAG TPA: hypothetical protein VEG44_01530 [Candidatus Acidoferrales bacterium]|nr:hypothetical protein [Candidatus Acidoferrales bacterium]